MPIIEPPTHAINAFGLNGSVYYNNLPLHQFMFAVRFNVNPASGLRIDEDAITYVIKNVTLGGADIESDVVNEYNRSRIVHNKIRFQNTTIAMHDVADGKSMRLWEKYYEYYYLDGRDLPGFGYNTALIPGNNRRYVFDSIDIYQFQAGKANRTRLEKPKILSYDGGTLNYEDGAALKEVSFTFSPEYITYDRNMAIPGKILRQLQEGGTPDRLAGAVNNFISTTTPKDSDTLSSSLLKTLREETLAASASRAVRNVAGSSFTASAVDLTATGSTVSNTSRSSLDSFGRVVEALQRKTPAPKSENKSKRVFTVSSTKIAAPDGNTALSKSNNDGNFQGGNN